jgi:predicted short-subunit dehydrogenase-like oxidoreductase (DUF2520 family)
MTPSCNGRKFIWANLKKFNLTVEGVRITLIGAGNLANGLGKALKAAGHEFEQVYSRTIESASLLAAALEAEAVVDPQAIRPDADCYFCALKDDALSDVLPLIRFGDGVLLHSAGSLSIDVLLPYSHKVGVLYPLQTFSKAKIVDFRTIPIFIESNDSSVEDILFGLAGSLSNNVQLADSKKRMSMHVSAVFACNFVNYMYTIASDILRDNDLDIQILIPLILETAEKLKTISPIEAQTGPAVRFDRKVMDKHLEVLSGHPDWQKFYEVLSTGIYQRQHSKN